MKRLHSLFARPIVRIVFLTTLVVVAVTLIILGNMPRWTAHSTAQPIAASEAAAIVKNGEARSIEVQLDHAYLKTDSAEYVFVKDREASVPQMLATLGVSSADMAKLTYSSIASLGAMARIDYRARSSSAVSSAVGKASSRSSGIGRPLSIERP